MEKYYVFLAPEKGEPYRFVKGIKRRWLFWKKMEYSYVPTVVKVENYEQLHRLQLLAAKDSGRGTKVSLADKMEECCGDNLFWAVMDKDGLWFTGCFTKRQGDKHADAETTADIREAQLFVRETFAIDQMRDLRRSDHKAVVVPVYVDVENVFSKPCIVTLCVNKRTCAVRYLKSYKRGDHRLRYTDSLADAMLIYPEQMDDVYEYLSSNHKELSFTMIVRPKANLAACEVKKHEAELIQRMSADYYIGKKK